MSDSMWPHRRQPNRLLHPWSSLYILNINPYQIYDLQNFLPICELPFHLTDSDLWCTEVLNFHEVQFIYFVVFVACGFGVPSKKSLSNPVSWDLLLMLHSKCFIVLSLPFQIFSISWFNFCIWCKATIFFCM